MQKQTRKELFYAYHKRLEKCYIVHAITVKKSVILYMPQEIRKVLFYACYQIKEIIYFMLGTRAKESFFF